jgi:hypothetical protein
MLTVCDVCCASAGALAAQTDVLALMSALKGAGAQILPEVWHRETTRYVANTAAAVFPAAAAGAKSGAYECAAGARSGTTCRSYSQALLRGFESYSVLSFPDLRKSQSVELVSSQGECCACRGHNRRTCQIWQSGDGNAHGDRDGCLRGR